ncbi:metal-sulfur cluster assembly factor [Candidatus Woesearchaeota archaeon]|nr:metal-sulfur cluster assembly factor [Candidatus Woesearchaeota archaeon]
MINKENVIEVLKNCFDPEVHVDVYTMGLIYEIKTDFPATGVLYIKMTLTTPTCPYGPQLLQEIKSKLSEIKNVKEVKLEVTFNPQWQPSKELRAILGV